MLVSDVLRVKGHNVVKINATDSVELAVRQAGRASHWRLDSRRSVDEPGRHILGTGLHQRSRGSGRCNGAQLASPTTDVDTHYQLSLLRSVWMPCLRR